MSMGKRVVEIVVKATDNASGALGGVGKKLADLSKQYPALAVVGGLAMRICTSLAPASRTILTIFFDVVPRTIESSSGLNTALSCTRKKSAKPFRLANAC